MIQDLPIAFYSKLYNQFVECKKSNYLPAVTIFLSYLSEFTFNFSRLQNLILHNAEWCCDWKIVIRKWRIVYQRTLTVTNIKSILIRHKNSCLQRPGVPRRRQLIISVTTTTTTKTQILCFCFFFMLKQIKFEFILVLNDANSFKRKLKLIHQNLR